MTWNDIIYSHFVVIFGKLKNKEYKNPFHLFLFSFSLVRSRLLKLLSIFKLIM